MRQRTPLVVMSVLLVLSLAGNWYLQRSVKVERKNNNELVTKNKQQKKKLADFEATQQMQKPTEENNSNNDSESSGQTESTGSTKDINDNLESLIVLLYSSKNKDLNDRYKKFEPLITGEAKEQLKPQKDDSKDDYVSVPNEINNINVYPKFENGKYSAIATYDMENKINKKSYTNHMIMNVDLTEKQGEMLISKINFNSGINN